ncbi:MAG: tetratricopeptide repeat protein [Deltaproteobacteria bacterium]|nr:tetratricopeptide repeat protein [Deltaproteobacteria bacterium]
MTPPLSLELLRQLSERIEQAMGLYFPPDRFLDLDRKIRAAARELAFLDVEAFANWLLSSPLASDRVRMLAGYLTVGETYFYREPRAWEVLQREILPTLLTSRAGENQRLRLWSAACSTGEEPYTMAMTLAQTIPSLQDWQCLILATDINPNVIHRAKAGVYSAWSFRGIPSELKSRYFCPLEKGQFALHPDIKKMVTFAEANIANPDLIPNSGLMDVIFCRNVLFYFSPERVKRVLERFYDALVDGGWLIVSPVETTYLTDLPFVPVLIDGTTVYRKDALNPRKPMGWSVPTPWFVPLGAEPASPLVETPALPRMVWPPVFAPEELPLPKPVFVAAVSPVAEAAPPPPPVVVEEPEATLSLYEQAQRAYELGKYEYVVATLLPLCRSLDTEARPTADTNQPFTLLARAYANHGQLAEARSWCEKALRVDQFNPSLHYLLATVLLEQERVTEATRALQKAVYADPDFVLAHFALGNLLHQQRRYADANRYLTSALSILRRTPMEDILPESEGLTAGRLTALVNSMLGGNRR